MGWNPGKVDEGLGGAAYSSSKLSAAEECCVVVREVSSSSPRETKSSNGRDGTSLVRETEDGGGVGS